MSILQTENLTKIYGDGENAVHALRGINLTVEKGEFTAIVGTRAIVNLLYGGKRVKKLSI